MNTTGSEREIEFAAQPLNADDLALLNALRAHYDETDPVPAGLIERIQFELTLDALRAEVAILTTMEPESAGIRSAATESVRTVTFTSETLTTMVTISPQPDGTVRVDGWATPITGVRVVVHLAKGSQETISDEDGRFVFEGLPSGLAKFALHLPDQQALAGVATVLSPTIEL